MPSNRTRLILKTAAATLVLAGLAGATGGFVALRSGLYDTTATSQHLQPVFSLLEQGMRYSVRHHSSEVNVPPLGAPQQVARGALVYAAQCAQCHGGPGFAQAKIGQSMQPVPGPLVDASARWKPRELYWITKHGIKMSGMPAWQFHLSEADLWAVVSFMGVLPTLSARDYAQATGAPNVTETPASAPTTAGAAK
jgi:mono/diheme cytochrome c family protein